MSANRDLRVRNRTLVILLFPVTLFLFTFGWLIQQISERNVTGTPQKKQVSAQTNGLQIHIATTEEHEEYND